VSIFAPQLLQSSIAIQDSSFRYLLASVDKVINGLQRAIRAMAALVSLAMGSAMPSVVCLALTQMARL
jgi:hypothetical protein